MKRRFGALMVNIGARDDPPPGLGETTVTDAMPAVAISVRAMAARSWVLLTTVVGRGLPFHWTTDPATKWLPVAVSVTPVPPAVALLGERELSVGTGLLM